MTGMFYLCNVFQLVIDCFNRGSFPDYPVRLWQNHPYNPLQTLQNKAHPDRRKATESVPQPTLGADKNTIKKD